MIIPRINQVRRKIPLYNKADWCSFHDHITSVHNSVQDMDLTSSVDDLWSIFKQGILTGIDKYIPHKFAKARNGKPWVKKPLQRLIAKRNRHYSKYRATGSHYHKYKYKYKQTKAKVQKGIRSSYWAYVEDIATSQETKASHGKCNKKFWSFIKHSRKESSGIPDLKASDGSILTNSKAKVNESKCKVMHYGKTTRKADYNLGGVNIKEVSEEKDLRVTFDQQLSFGTNASKVVAAANSRLGLINRHFRHLDTKPFMNLYKTLVRPKVEYCMTVAQPVFKKDKEKIERVQRRATKLVKGMENKAYSERLEELKLPSLEYRRKRADVIQTYKIMNNIDRIDGKKFFKPCKEVRTRGHLKRVEKTQCKSLVRRNAFSQRMANDWNALPDAVVMSGSINQFKARLGRWWKNDPILYRNIRSPQATKHSAIAIYNAREGHQPC